MSEPCHFQPSGYHCFCTEFPPADQTDCQNIVNSMLHSGFQESDPITLYGNEILDARTRYEVAIVAMVPGITTTERAEIANVSPLLQRNTNTIATHAPEFKPPIAKGPISATMLQPVAKAPTIRQDVLGSRIKFDPLNIPGVCRRSLSCVTLRPVAAPGQNFLASW